MFYFHSQHIYYLFIPNNTIYIILLIKLFHNLLYMYIAVTTDEILLFFIFADLAC